MWVFIIFPIFMNEKDSSKLQSHLFLSIFSTWYHQLLLWWWSLTIQNQVGTSKCRGILSSAEVWTDCTPWLRRRGWGRTWTGCRGVSGGRWWCCTSDSWSGLQGTVEVTVFQPILFLTEVLSFCSTTNMTNHNTCNKIMFHHHLNHEWIRVKMNGNVFFTWRSWWAIYIWKLFFYHTKSSKLWIFNDEWILLKMGFFYRLLEDPGTNLDFSLTPSLMSSNCLLSSNLLSFFLRVFMDNVCEAIFINLWTLQFTSTLKQLHNQTVSNCHDTLNFSFYGLTFIVWYQEERLSHCSC